jgi:hypothetical protein
MVSGRDHKKRGRLLHRSILMIGRLFVEHTGALCRNS